MGCGGSSDTKKAKKSLNFKMKATTCNSRVKQKRGKLMNSNFLQRKKIIDFVKSNSYERALIFWSPLINDENMVLAYDQLSTMIDQLKNKAADIESYNVEGDIKDNANAVVFCSSRLDIPDLDKFAKTLKVYMDSKEYQNAVKGNCDNEVIRRNIWSKEPLDSQKWLKLVEVWRDAGVSASIPGKIKMIVREYWHRENIPLPTEFENNPGAHEVPTSGSAISPPIKQAQVPVPQPPPRVEAKVHKSSEQSEKSSDSDQPPKNDKDSDGQGSLLGRLEKLRQ